MLDRFIEYTCRILRVRFSVYFERLCPRVGCVIGLVKEVSEDRRCFLKGLASFLVCDGEKYMLAPSGRSGMDSHVQTHSASAA